MKDGSVIIDKRVDILTRRETRDSGALNFETPTAFAGLFTDVLCQALHSG